MKFTKLFGTQLVHLTTLIFTTMYNDVAFITNKHMFVYNAYSEQNIAEFLVPNDMLEHKFSLFFANTIIRNTFGWSTRFRV